MTQPAPPGALEALLLARGARTLVEALRQVAPLAAALRPPLALLAPPASAQVALGRLALAAPAPQREPLAQVEQQAVAPVPAQVVRPS
jgi:hypothetical protein